MSLPAGPHATDSGLPPADMRLRAIVARARDDSIATWSRLMQGRAVEVAAVTVQFVSRLAPANCYGLYSGDGPAYCSGNQTVFVGTAAAGRLMSRFGPQAEAGIAFLIGHEIGHHIQNLNGRFHALSQAIYTSPQDGPDYVRRFELQADCLAGVWIHDSAAWATSSAFRADLLAVLTDIGDDTVLAGQPHGQSASGRPARDGRAAPALVSARRADRRHGGVRHVRRAAALASQQPRSQKALPRYWLTSQAMPLSAIVLHTDLASATVSSGPATRP